MVFLRVVFEIIRYGTILGVLYFIYTVSQRLSSPNPFARTLKRPAYTLMKPLGFFDYEISFSEKATIDSLRESIFHIYYCGNYSPCDHRYPSIRFTSFHSWNFITRYFYPFHFSVISFNDVDTDQFCCTDYFDLPCRELYLPSGIKDIDFSIDTIPYIEELVLHSSKFIPLHYYSDTYFLNPIRVNNPLNVRVPDHLLRTYRTDPGWRSIRLVTPEGDIISPTFNGLEPFDPSTKPSFRI